MDREEVIQSLRKQVREFGERYNLKEDNLFTLWFLRAYLTDSEDAAAAAVTGGTRDKDVDAILIDDNARTVFVVQSKYRLQSFGRGRESRPDVISFADLSSAMSGTDGAFNQYSKGMSPFVRSKLKDGRERVLKRGYRLHMCFVTLGKVSRDLQEEAYRRVRGFLPTAQIEFVDASQVPTVLDDYLGGVAPPIRAIDLRIEPGGLLYRTEPSAAIKSWLFSMKGSDVASLFDQARDRIFARNIRGFLDETKVNSGMLGTLKREPQHFVFFNNGVTIVCDRADERGPGDEKILNVSNPQVINGQQTTRTLHESGLLARKASVLVRVVEIPRKQGKKRDARYELLVSKIVEATNRQNAIKPSDLRANDPMQIAIERELRKFGYQYLRKRMTKAEAARVVGSQYRMMIKKEDLAKAVADCLRPSLSRLAGREKLFDDDEYYNLVFGGRSARFYLSCYWLTRLVASAAWGSKDRKWAKLVVQHFLWNNLGEDLLKHADRFIDYSQTRDYSHPARRQIERAIDLTFRAALGSYRKNRNTGDGPVDIQTYFKREESYELLETYWRSRQNRVRTQFTKVRTELLKSLAMPISA